MTRLLTTMLMSFALFGLGTDTTTATDAAGFKASRSATGSTSVVPQIVLTDAIVDGLNAQRESDADLSSDIGRLVADADAFLNVPTISDEFRAEHNARPSELHRLGEKSVERLTTLGLAWRLTGDPRFARRGREELLGLAQLETWYPAHFLGLSRISLAVTLGYSWLADALSAEDREAIATALIDKALRHAEELYGRDRQYYDGGWVVPHLWVPPVEVQGTLPDGTATADITWPVASFNWNIVCNTGMALAAMAVSASQPDLAARIFDRATVSIRNGLSLFAPEGAWPEGPMYGALSGRDAAIFFSALESVHGHDFGLSKAAGIPSFGDYLMHVTGPTGLLFNYGDSETTTDFVVLPWLSNRFGRPDYSWRKAGAPGLSLPALNLIWRQTEGVSPSLRQPKALWFGDAGLVTMRSAWDDPDATYVAFKAGPVQSHHNNLDAGTFVLDAKGVRWAVDLGRGNYLLPGYFTSERFRYYRTATIGQNTLAFDGANQKTNGRAFIEDFAQFPGFDFAIGDLSDPYNRKSGTVRRRVALVGDEAVLVQDEIAAASTGAVTWTMHTAARIDIDGPRATLKQDGKQMTAVILSPAGATFHARSADPCQTKYDTDCADQHPNTGIQRLMISLVGKDLPDEPLRIVVLFSEEADRAPSSVMPVIPLDEWRLRATLARETGEGTAIRPSPTE